MNLRYNTLPDIFLWDNLLRNAVNSDKAFSPAVDVVEKGNRWDFYFDLPGVKEENTEITLDGNQLVVSAKRDIEVEVDKGGYHYAERSHGEFRRSFTLPNSVDPEKIKAETKDGVLTISIGKTGAIQPKRIALTKH